MAGGYGNTAAGKYSFAAIQGLNRKLEAQNAELKAQIEALKAENRRIGRLEAQVREMDTLSPTRRPRLSQMEEKTVRK